MEHPKNRHEGTPLRFAYFCSDPGIPVFGNKGASIHVREMCHALQAIGHDVLVFASRPEGSPRGESTVAVHEHPLDPDDGDLYRLLRDDPDAGPAAAAAVRAMLAATALRHRSAPALRRFRPDAIYERYALFGTAGMTLARELGIPLVLEVNAPLSEEQATHRGLGFAQTARTVEKTILCAADHVVAVSRQVADWACASGVPPDRVRVLPNGVDADRFAAGAPQRETLRTELGIAPAQRVVGFVGTLKAWHGTAALIRAVAMLHRQRTGHEPPHLLIVGDGPECTSLQDLARQEGIAATTTFTGAVRHERMPAYLAAMDVAVAPYDHAPGFYFSPLKLFEYLAAGRPVVAADVGQIAECVRHGETGVLYPPGDVPALAAAIDTLLRTPADAAELGRAGQRDVRQHRSWQANAAAVAGMVRDGRPASLGGG